MKKLIIALAALMVSIAAYGQGQFAFNNRVLPDINARFILQGVDPAAGTTSSIGSPDYSIQLLAGSAGTPTANLTALTPTVSFRGAAGTTLAGYASAANAFTVPGVDVNGSASVLVRVLGPGGVSSDFGPYTVTLGGGTVLPPNLPLGTTALPVVPEPGTLVLAALGLGALLAIRRRK